MFLYWLQICVLLIIFRSAQAALARYVTADVNLASISPSSILQDGGNESPHPQSPHGFAAGEPQGSKEPLSGREYTVGVNLE